MAKKKQTKQEVKPKAVELESVTPELEPVVLEPKEEVPFAEKIKTIGMGTKPKTGSKTLPNGTTIKYN